MMNKPSDMKNLKSRKLYLQVYDELRNYIVQNQLQPGDKLPTEMEMCEVLGVSRNVLREAIKSLEISGIVSSKPGVGIIIQEFSPSFLFHSLLYNLYGDSTELLNQTLAVRRTLELGFMSQAFDTLTSDDLLLLDEQTRLMREIYEMQKLKTAQLSFGLKFYEADATFHKILYSHTENNVLTSIIDAVWACDKYHKQRIHSTYMEQTVVKHEKILAALIDKDFEVFSQAMYYHFNENYKNL
ncbi:MAG: GntR family transcriptional regulator [Niameybacter sp.]|uniref:FadR/GntR family transcriptional regulator n=1 Tax=Niameybacter sp. TaxID=2033640 RepID=UPI002FCB23F3